MMTISPTIIIRTMPHQGKPKEESESSSLGEGSKKQTPLVT